MLTISAKDFGPIIEGTVDLKPLTVFVGPSNTGKSYMATLVHAMVNALNGYGLFPAERRVTWKRHITGFDRLWKMLDEDSGVEESVMKWAELLEEDSTDDEVLTVADVPAEVRSELDRLTIEALKTFQKDVLEYLQQEYGEVEAFVRLASNKNNFRLNFFRNDPLLDVIV